MKERKMQTEKQMTAAVLFIVASVCVTCRVCTAGDLSELMPRWENPKTPPALAPPDELAGPYLTVAAEASPDRMRKVRAEYMNSSQVVARLRSGDDIAILPLGSMEAHGLHAPLSTKSLIAHATAILLGERWNATVFPPIRYSYTGTLERRPGTVSISIEDTNAYTSAVIDCLLDGGFKRVVLLAADNSFNLHGQFLVNSIHRRRGELPLYCEIDLLPDSAEITKTLGCQPTDDIRAMAALKILGHPGVFKQRRGKTHPRAVADGFDRASSRLRKAQIVVPLLTEPATDVMPAQDVVAEALIDKAIAIMRREARKRDEFPGRFRRYQEETKSQINSAPWSLENYAKFVKPPRAKAKARPVERSAPERSSDTVEEENNADCRIPVSSLPLEASEDYKRLVRAEFMSASQIAEKLKRGEDLAILPLGAFEMHGPHGLLDTDTIQAYSRAIMLAGGWKAAVMPPIHYTHTGATEFWPGTVSVSAEATVRYVKAVVESLLDAGFKRVALLWFHYPGRIMGQRGARGISRQRAAVISAIDLGFKLAPADEVMRILGYRYGEDIGALAGVKILGHHGLFVVDEPMDIPGQWDAQPGWELRKMGVAGRAWYMTHATQHLHVRSCIKLGDEDKLIEIMRAAVKQQANVPEIMSEYLKESSKLRDQAPWKWENWRIPGSQ